jgi:hypothetical protein
MNKLERLIDKAMGYPLVRGIMVALVIANAVVCILGVIALAVFYDA